jgi:hypothetical protein
MTPKNLIRIIDPETLKQCEEEFKKKFVHGYCNGYNWKTCITYNQAKDPWCPYIKYNIPCSFTGEKSFTAHLKEKLKPTL